MKLWSHIAERIARAENVGFEVLRQRAVGGGCISSAYVVEDDAHSYFVKLNRRSGLEMFQAEAEGLRAISETGALRVPRPIVVGVAQEQSFLVMELLDLDRGGHGRAAYERLGRGLAALHRATASRFGWHLDNTIGATPQHNAPTGDWLAFWREHRLGFQLRLAADNGHRGRLQSLGERLSAGIHHLFDDYRPVPSLLHGDLWSGNYAVLSNGEPAVFDPAVYYGDREADLAMTELFGGFPDAFYRAYDETWPLDAGYEIRKTLYNLYHILNHLNLFGGGYAYQAESMMERLLSELD